MLGGTKEVFSGIDEIAEFLRVSPAVLRRWLSKGLVNINKLGKSYTATREQLQEIIKSGVDESEVFPVIVYDESGECIGHTYQLISVNHKGG